MWRHYFGDTEALLKATFLVLSQRAAADCGDSFVITRADLHVLLSSYRIGKHSSPVVTTAVERLITSMEWDDDSTDFTTFEKAVRANDVLKNAFIGYCDESFTYHSERGLTGLSLSQSVRENGDNYTL